MPGPNQLQTPALVENKEGVIAETDLVSLDLSDEDIARVVGDRVETSKKWWDKEYNLTNVGQSNERYWLKQSLDKEGLYPYQTPYENNRIFINIESLIPRAISKPAQPVVTKAYDTDASEELAENLQKVLLALYADLYLHEKAQMVARHLLIGYRRAFMKYRWDMTIGQMKKDDTGNYKAKGGLAVDVPRPEKIILDARATNKDDIPLIGEYLTSTLDELCYKFPKKQNDIYKYLGYTSGQVAGGNKDIGYVETWFSYFKDTKKEALCWKLGPIVLDKMKNPNWNYDVQTTNDQGQEVYTNFNDRPMKPYIVFSHLNLGKYVIDDTSLVEQAATLQDVLDKRGRQIIENADHANSGTIYNSQMINEETVAKITGDPQEKVMADGDISKAAMRLPMNELPPYVLQDKQDTRGQIDDVFGAHEPVKGDQSGNKTLGQDVLSTQNDLTRISTLATSIEGGFDRLYKGMVQMMKVFWDADELVKYTGSEGKTDFITFSQNKIEDGISIRVKVGSVMPTDAFAKQQEAVQLAPILDPLTLAEDLNKENPREYAKRFFLNKADPERYASEVLGIDPQGNNDAGAASDIQGINGGQQVPPTENPTQDHLAQHQAFIQSPQFKQLPPQAQQAHLDHAKQELANAKQGLGNQVSALPPHTPGPVQNEVLQQNGGTPTPTPTGNTAPPEGLFSRALQLLRGKK